MKSGTRRKTCSGPGPCVAGIGETFTARWAVSPRNAGQMSSMRYSSLPPLEEPRRFKWLRSAPVKSRVVV